MVVLAAVAVIGVVISVIAAAIAVLPRSNRYAIRGPNKLQRAHVLS